MTMRVAWLAVAVALGGCGGVETRLDSASGGDAARDQAMAVFLERTVTDRVDAPNGDHTDWKYIDILDRGRLKIEVSFDSPEKLKGGEVEFTDEFGSRLDRQLVLGGQSNYIFTREIEKVPTKFFIRVFTQEGRTVYTVGSEMAYLPPENPDPPPQPTVAVPKQVEDPPPQKRNRRARTRTRPKPPVTKPPPPPPEPDPGPSGPTFASGRVIRVIPAEDDQSVTLTIRLGTADPVDKSTTATAYKGGSRLGRVRILKVSGRTITGQLDLPPGKVTGAIEVRFDLR